MSQRERMSGVDTAWLHMDRPTNLMMIVGVLMLEERVDFERLQRTIAARLLHFERFRQCVVEDATGASWVADREFDIAAHVHRAALPSPADKAALEAFAQELDRRRDLALDGVPPLDLLEVGGGALREALHGRLNRGNAQSASTVPAPGGRSTPHS